MSAYELNRLLYSLRHQEERAACRADPEAYYRRYRLNESQLQLLLRQDWQGLIDAGANIYLLTKLGATLDVSLFEIGASMRAMSMEEFQRFTREQAEQNRKYAILAE